MDMKTMNDTNMHNHHTMPMMEGDSMGMKMNGTGGMDMMMMQMYFVVSSKVTLIFKEWRTTNPGEMIGSCITLFVIGILYEGLKVYRQKMLLRPLQKLRVPVDSNQGDGSDLKFIRNSENISWKRFTRQRIIQSLLHMVQTFVGYLLMLAVMTYNVWVCMAVVLGAGCGYFLFDAQPMLLNSDHCN